MRLLQKLEFITDAPNSFEKPFIGNAIEFFAQAFDVNVYCARVAEVIKAPNFIEQLVTGENAVIVGSKEIEELEFLGRNINALAAKLEFVFLAADFNVFKFNNFAVAGCFA